MSQDTEPGKLEDQKILWLQAQKADHYDPFLPKTLLTPNV